MSDDSLTLPVSDEAVPLTTEELLLMLLPTRNYGTRTYEEVVEQVRAGVLYLQPGHGNLPVIRDAQTRMTVKGTGLVLGSGAKASTDSMRAKFYARFDERSDDWIDALEKSALEDKDPRALKLGFEMRLGKAGEAREGAMSGVLQRLFDMAERGMLTESKNSSRDVVVEVKPE